MELHRLPTKTYQESIHKRINRMIHVSGGLATAAAIHAYTGPYIQNESTWLFTQSSLIVGSILSLGYFIHQEKYNSTYEHDNDRYNSKADPAKDGGREFSFFAAITASFLATARSVTEVNIQEPTLSFAMFFTIVGAIHLMAKTNVERLPLKHVVKELHEEHAYHLDMTQEALSLSLHNSLQQTAMNASRTFKIYIPCTFDKIKEFARLLPKTVSIPDDLIFMKSGVLNGLWSHGTNCTFNTLLFGYLKHKDGQWNCTVRTTDRTFSAEENKHIEAGIALLYLSEHLHIHPDELFETLRGTSIPFDDTLIERMRTHIQLCGTIQGFGDGRAMSHTQEEPDLFI